MSRPASATASKIPVTGTVAATLMLAGVSTASAQFVYSGSVNTDLMYSGAAEVSFDFNGGGDDLKFELIPSSSGVPDTAYKPYVTALGSTNVVQKASFITGLAEGAPIGSAQSFAANGGYYSGTAGPATFVGFSLTDGSTTQYGWVRTEFMPRSGEDVTVVGLNIVDWAYRTDGQEILAGQISATAIPEPASAATMAAAAALLAGSVGMWRRRQSRAKAAA